MRAAEYALFACAALLPVLWFTNVLRPSRRVLVLAVLLLATFGFLLLRLGEDRAVRGPYQPARLQDGRIVP